MSWRSCFHSNPSNCNLADAGRVEVLRIIIPTGHSPKGLTHVFPPFPPRLAPAHRRCGKEVSAWPSATSSGAEPLQRPASVIASTPAPFPASNMTSSKWSRLLARPATMAWSHGFGNSINSLARAAAALKDLGNRIQDRGLKGASTLALASGSSTTQKKPQKGPRRRSPLHGHRAADWRHAHGRMPPSGATQAGEYESAHYRRAATAPCWRSGTRSASCRWPRYGGIPNRSTGMGDAAFIALEMRPSQSVCILAGRVSSVQKRFGFQRYSHLLSADACCRTFTSTTIPPNRHAPKSA